MIKEDIYIANLKCSGCATTIEKEIKKIGGVRAAIADPESDKVTVEWDGERLREKITSRLLELGYPEATEENGLLLQLKSYASCMTGRISNLTASLGS